MAAVDRISDLPEPILHHILSFLSQQEAIQTSVLSEAWRHVGPTRPKIEFRESCFQKSSRPSLLSVLGKTLQRYNHRNLPVHEFILEMSFLLLSPDHRRKSISVLDKGIPTLLINMGKVKKFDFSVPRYRLDPSLVFRAEFLTELYLSQCNLMTSTTTNNNNNNNCKPLFKGLKRLSLRRVSVAEETFVQIMLSCPLIEYLSVSDCLGLKIIPVSSIFQAEFLTELHLSGCKLTGSTTRPILIKRLKSLYLKRVYIREETLEEMIMCISPLIQRVLLSGCVKLPTIQLNNNANNKKRSRSFELISLNWYGHDKYFFPRLKSLNLNKVRLSAELFESFSCNFPSLEELELRRCYGFSEIQLTVSSIKRLVLLIDSTERMVITIYAPNIRSFELSVYALPKLIFHTETAREWESHVVMLFDKLSKDKILPLSWLLQLSELLNSLRESQISLDVFPNSFENLRLENTNDVILCKPILLELVCVKEDIYQSCSFPDFLDCLFLICRPRYIGMNWCGYPTNSIFDVLIRKANNKLAEFIISEMMIRNQQGEMSRGYLWERDLEEISMQAWNQKSKGWNNVRIDGTSFPQFTTSNTKIRFPLKWKGS